MFYSGDEFYGDDVTSGYNMSQDHISEDVKDLMRGGCPDCGGKMDEEQARIYLEEDYCEGCSGEGSSFAGYEDRWLDGSYEE